MIKPTDDRKTQAYRGQKNTFGLLPGDPRCGGTCPGATFGPGGCRESLSGRVTPVCYVERILALRPAVCRVLAHNTRLLLDTTYDQRLALFLQEFLRFYSLEKRKKRTTDLRYRLHWSGDIPDEEYACALREAIEACPFIQFWGYTRSFFSVPILAGLKNLAWYLSLDSCNFDEGWKVYQKHKDAGNIHIALMAKNNRKLPDGTRLVACPVDEGKKALELACFSCRQCFSGKSIFFRTRS